jgi:hypothetical protein
MWKAPAGARRKVLHKSFNRSGLVRLLGDWSPAEADASRQDIAERLGQWLSVPDTIALRTAHRSIQATRPMPGKPPSGDLAQELQRVRETLVKSIQASTGGGASEVDTDFALVHQRYLEQQRRMEMSIDALRSHVRSTLSQATPRLAQLAALDATLDQLLGGRAQHLLSTVPAFLKKRFEQVRRQQADEAGADDQPPSMAWSVAFAQDMEQALLAELETRLQPIKGMVDALSNELNSGNS